MILRNSVTSKRFLQCVVQHPKISISLFPNIFQVFRNIVPVVSDYTESSFISILEAQRQSQESTKYVPEEI